MFGQASTPFGSPPGGGGFGQTNTAPAFGSPAPAPFGAPAPAAYGGFGAPAPAPAGFGGFGAPAPAPAGFGGGFGTPAPAPAFGSSGGFGSAPAASSPFGAPAPAPSGGLFGAPAAPSGGLFGAPPAPAPAGFGAAPSSFGGFGGASAAATPAFGGGSTFGAPAPAPSTGLFGAPAPAPGGFGASGFGSTTSSFGAPAPAPSGGLFGAPPAAPAGGMFGSPAPVAVAGGGGGGGGSKIQPYQVTSRQDGTSSINLQAITAMPAYESKSFEELRFEDYSQGNRGASTPSAGGGFGGGFGAPAPAPAPAGGLFGAAPSTGFGSPAPAPGGFGGSFGAPAPAAFGAAAPAAFGAPAPAAFGAPAPAAFGSPAPAPGGFGGAFGAKPPAPGGLFGAPAPAPGGLFGSAPAPAPGGLFGSTPAPAAAFGAPPPAAGGLFGAPAAPSGGLFGAPPAPAPAGFGGNSFGAPSAGFGGFGSPAPAPGGGLFGAPAPVPAYGAPAAGGLFGAPAPGAGASLFGAPAPAPSMFGGPAAPPPPGYGAPMAAPAMYGAPAQAQYMPSAPPVGSVMPAAANEILTSQLAALENKRKEMEKSDNFRSKPTESSSVNAITLSETNGMSSFTPVRALYPTYRASPRSSAKVRPRGFASPEKTATPSLSRLGSGGTPMPAPDSLAASSVTRLVINPSPKPKMRLLLGAPQASSARELSPLKINATPHISPANGIPPLRGTIESSTPKTPVMESRSSPKDSGMQTPGSGGKGFNYYQQVIESPEEAVGASPARKSAVPKLSKAGYTCTPSIEVLQTIPGEDLAAVANFSVERPGVGKIEWEGAVDIRGADLDDVVIIEPKSASVYSKDEEENRKPKVGTKLNRPAIITLEGIFPSEDTLSGHDKFARKVERQTKKMGAELIGYDVASGEWKLRVVHFSRYGLTDDDSDSDAESNFESGEREGRSRDVTQGILKQRKATPYKPRAKMARVSTDEEEEETALVSDVEMSEDSKVLEDAETAFTSMQLALKQDVSGTRRKREEDSPFPEEIVAKDGIMQIGHFVPSADDLLAASSMGGICSNIAKEAGVKSSNVDFGLHMGRSFRVGWSPDGSLLCLKPGGVLVRRRPIFAEPGSNNHLNLLEKHQVHSLKVKEGGSCPQFFLPPTSDGSDKLQSALKSYAADEDGSHVGRKVSMAKQSFSLLKCLLDSKEDRDGQLVEDISADRENVEGRLVHAVKRWLVDSCSNEVDKEVSSEKRKGKTHAALLVAVSGGDLEKACAVAEELGHLQLATMLASGPEARHDILKEVMAWADGRASSKIPDDLIRAYFLLAGELKMEEDIYRRKFSPFDWRRRLAMRLAYDTPNGQTSLSSVVQEYEGHVSRGVAPYPLPRYLSSKSRQKSQCVLYRLLRVGKHELEVSLREIIDPLGHTSNAHDFRLSFHLAAAVSAMGCSSPLTHVEEQNLIDGYVAQLITQGNWEWAVYVTLCLLDASSSTSSAWKKQRGRTLVLQNFREDSADSEPRRQFLESVGVPSEWFEEALALRCSSNGDSYGFLQHMVNVSPEVTCAALEHILIPNTLFMNKDRLEEARRLLEVFSVDDSSLASAVFNFFQVYQNILLLEGASRAEIDAAMPALLETCENVEQVFAAYRSGEEKLQGPTLHLLPDTILVPMASFLAEGLSQISLFKLQLRALQSGISISSTASQILNLSQPKGFNESGISARENICRWLM